MTSLDFDLTASVVSEDFGRRERNTSTKNLVSPQLFYVSVNTDNC